MPDHDGPPGWLQRFHDASHGKFDTLSREIADLKSAVATGFDRMDHRLNQINQEIQTMSSSLSDQLTAALASISADVDVVSAEVTALVAALSGQVGQPVTQAMVDAANSIDQRLKAIPPAPAAPAP